MAVLAVQKISQAGLNPAFQAADVAGDAFPNGGRSYLHVKNSGAGSINVTVNSQKPCDQGFDHDLVVAVPNGGERLIGPFDPRRFNDANGRVAVTYSGVTGVTVAAIEV